MTYCAWACDQKMRPVGVTKKGKIGQKLSCVKLDICPDHPRRHRPLKFCMRGLVLEIVIYFKFNENRSKGLGAVGSKIALSQRLGRGLYTACTSYRTSRDMYSMSIAGMKTV